MTFWIVVFFDFCFPLVLANAFVVSSRAEAIAGHRPYCIQYASQTDPYEYEPAGTAFDLSALKMQARLMAGGGTLFNFEHYAVLVIDDGERQFFNWSYWRENLLEEVINRGPFKEPSRSYLAPKVVCHPRPISRERSPFGPRTPLLTRARSESIIQDCSGIPTARESRGDHYQCEGAKLHAI